jgi:hypothetical protein
MSTAIHHGPQLKIIDYRVLTVARPVPYIGRLLARLHPDLPVTFLVGSPAGEYLGEWRSNPSFEFLFPEDNEWLSLKEHSVHHRASWNYWRALTLGRSALCRKGVVVFEDDILPVINWEAQLYGAMAEIEAFYDGPFLLALYAGQPQLEALRLPYRIAPYPSEVFYGTQALYYPEAVREGFSQYLKNNGVDAFRIPYDHLLREYLILTATPAFLMVPCPVQHIGEISTGLGVYHKSTSFTDVTPQT